MAWDLRIAVLCADWWVDNIVCGRVDCFASLLGYPCNGMSSKFKQIQGGHNYQIYYDGVVLLNDGKLRSTISFFRTMEPWFLFHERVRDQKSRYLFSSTPTECLGSFISKGCILFVCYHLTSLLFSYWK